MARRPALLYDTRPVPKFGVETEYGATDFISQAMYHGQYSYKGRLPSGARAYVDSAHPEYATPPRASPKGVAQAWEKGHDVIRRVVLNEDREALDYGLLWLGNHDGDGNTWAFHENYSFGPRSYPMLSRLSDVARPFFAHRALWSGAGALLSKWLDAPFGNKRLYLLPCLRSTGYLNRGIMHKPPYRLHAACCDTPITPDLLSLRMGATWLYLTAMYYTRSGRTNCRIDWDWSMTFDGNLRRMAEAQERCLDRTDAFWEGLPRWRPRWAAGVLRDWRRMVRAASEDLTMTDWGVKILALSGAGLLKQDAAGYWFATGDAAREADVRLCSLPRPPLARMAKKVRSRATK